MQKDRVIQSSLKNGLTVLVCPKKDAAKVSIQLWYNVGSKHEKNGEKGIAHFIEHMIFKGTQKLSESDINLAVSKLSGYCNAFTSYDYTGYLFDIPVANWDKVLPIMADCMQHCTFKQEHLNSEVKAVIQELKMYRDNYSATLAEEMVKSIFEAHPYHHPIIGYKQDLWTVSRDILIDFYKKHYTPDNAAIVVVGDVDPEEVYKKVEAEFGSIAPGKGWNREKFYTNEDIKSKAVKIYRDVQLPISTMAFTIPGIVECDEFLFDAFAYILANGRGSRLYKLLVDDLQLVAGVNAYVYDLFDKAILFVEFHAKKEEDIDLIAQHIQKVIDDIALNGISTEEASRSQRLAQIEFQQMLEDTQRQAYAIGKSFVATQDPNSPFLYGHIELEKLAERIKNLAKEHFQSVVCHRGDILSIPKESLSLWKKLQEKSDKEDAEILGAKQRDGVVEEGDYVHTISLNEKPSRAYEKPESIILDNGLEVLWFHSDEVETVECLLDYKTTFSYDPKELQGLGYIASKLLLEGTKNLPGQEFSKEAESCGMVFSASPGHISTAFLGKDLEKGLSLLSGILTGASLEEDALKKVKNKMLMQLKSFWDTPTTFGVQLARDIIYKGHPYSNMILGSEDSLNKISRNDVLDFYKKMISPKGARLSLVGNLKGFDVKKIISETMGDWQGDVVEEVSFPALTTVKKEEIISKMNRDQVVLVFAGLSIDRFHEDYDKILLFDQIFTGGSLRSMSSKLFQLREQSGLFYTIGGSLLFGAGSQPGMILIKTIVSGDRIVEAERVIAQEIDNAIDTITQDELEEAKNALFNTFDLLYESNEQKASSFLFLRKYDLPFDYFEKRVETLRKITVAQVQEAVKKILSSEKLVRVKIGRL